ncbi:hypothetical protein PG988_010585 [Apiospora saccharicola]
MPSSPSLLSLETLGASVLNTGVLLRLLGAWFGYRLLLALYNVSPFHPLHKFPGPRWAAATFLYEFWYDFVRHGRYVNEIRKMHEVYGIRAPFSQADRIFLHSSGVLNSCPMLGPIVRINPEELHCLDSSFVNEIYPGGGRIRDKHRHYLNANVGPVAVTAFGSETHELHRMRRGPLNRFFSKAQMAKLEPSSNNSATSCWPGPGNPEKRQRLEKELAKAGVDPSGKNLSWAQLEQIPYLYGVVHETLRMCHGLSTRLARVARTEDLIYRNQAGFGWGDEPGTFEYVIPRGTPIGMSSGLTHRDASVFPEPEAFRPERWVTARGERNTVLEKCLLSFSKGSRICLGMNLAMCELYLTVAAVVLRVAPRMELVSENDDFVAMDHEVIIPKPKKGTKPITVVISPE